MQSHRMSGPSRESAIRSPPPATKITSCPGVPETWVQLQAMGPLNYYLAQVIGKKRSGPHDRD
jgi:hypothetical protein